MVNKKERWSWSWGWLNEDRTLYVYKTGSLFPWFIAFLMWIHPEGVGHWAGNVAHAFKEAF